MIDVVNLQRKVKIDLASVRKYISEVEAKVDELEGRTFSVGFISDDRMQSLNSTFREKDSTTDVLSFPFEPEDFEQGSPPYEGGVASASDDGVVHLDDKQKPENPLPAEAGLLFRKEKSLRFLGDIVISAQQAERQAKANKLTFEREIKQLILHGVLHLCGYDHETDKGEMNARELQLRKELKI